MTNQRVKEKNNQVTKGTIFIGIDEKTDEIYHAIFQKTNEKKLSPENQTKMIQAYKDNKNSQREEKWEQISICTFSLEKNRSIKMTIGRTVQDQVTFYLVPQK